jgi:hypothetical protein
MVKKKINLSNSLIKKLINWISNNPLLQKLQPVIYVIQQYITGPNLIYYLVFAFYFLFMDRKVSNSIKTRFDKTKSPNYTWRIFAVILYIPIWREFLLMPLLYYVERAWQGPYADFIFLTVEQYFEFVDPLEIFFGGTFSFISLYQLLLYYIDRLIILLVPPKIFRLPMYIRYHSMVCSLLIMLFIMFNDAFIWVSGISYNQEMHGDNIWWYTFVSTKDESFAMNCAFYTVIFYSAILLSQTLKAFTGLSFTDTYGVWDVFVRTHLSFESLYEDEKWRDFGMDEIDAYFEDED